MRSTLLRKVSHRRNSLSKSQRFVLWYIWPLVSIHFLLVSASYLLNNIFRKFSAQKLTTNSYCSSQQSVRMDIVRGSLGKSVITLLNIRARTGNCLLFVWPLLLLRTLCDCVWVCVCAYECVHVCECVWVCVRACEWVRLWACVCLWVWVCVLVSVRACECVCERARASVWVCVLVSVCACVCECVCVSVCVCEWVCECVWLRARVWVWVCVSVCVSVCMCGCFKLIIIIIIFICCNWVVNRWQWLFYTCTKHEIGYY